MATSRRSSGARAISGLFGFGIVLANVVVAGVGVGLAPAYGAQNEPSPFAVQIDSPASGATLANSSSVSVSGKIVATGIGASLDRIRLQIVRESDGATVVDTNLCCDSPKAGDVPFGPVSTAALTHNGPHRMTITASGYYDILITRSPAPPASAGRGFTLAVPADPPTNVKAQPVGERNVQLTWTAPSYPADFIGFAVYRKIGSGSFDVIKGLPKGETSFTDTTLGAVTGPVSYQVASVRHGAVQSDDPNNWLISRSEATGAITLPPLPTTVPPGGSTTTTAPGGGLQPDGAAKADLGGFFSSVPSFELPPASAPATVPFPDTGYSELLPFPSTLANPEATQPARPSVRTPVSTGDEEFAETEDVNATNRRALLVPVAAGSVLCVAALHLRWLNKRLAFVPPDGPGDGPGTGAGYPTDRHFELADPYDEEEAFLPRRDPVGARGR